MQAKSKIEQQVMASVAVVYTARQLVSKVALEFYAFVLSALAFWKLVWVHKIFANFITQERSGSALNYVLVALEHAHAGALLALGVCAVAAILLILDALRSGASSHTHTFAA